MLTKAGHRGGSWLSGDLNNARLISMTLYEGQLPAFRNLLRNCGEEIRCFYEKATEISQLEKSSRAEALEALAGG